MEATTKCELVVIADDAGWFDTPISEWTLEQATYRGLAVSLAIRCCNASCDVCHPEGVAA